MDKSKKLIIVIILLIIITGGVSFYAFRQAKENKEMSELFAVEKLEMENEYTTFATQYDELQIQINNDSLREKLESEKLKTQRLLEELRQVKTSNTAEIMRLKKELKTVRAVLRTYVIQIDSLNKLNQALAEENQEVKQKYTQATRQINSLSQEKKNLNEKVTLAAQLDATGINVDPRNKRGKTAKKVKDVKKIVVETADAEIKASGIELYYEVGTMIEIPRAALTADEIAAEADFFCFGTNDLTQMTFGFSRDDAGKFLTAYYDSKILENDPFAKLDQNGVGKLMDMSIKLGKPVNPKMHVGICGEHGGDPSSVEFCHKIGLDYVSCSPFRVPIARLAAAQAAINQK